MNIEELIQRSDDGKTRRVGIMGGTFDPIHNAHLLVAQEALTALTLDGVIFVPTGDSYHKHNRHVSSAEDRYMMTFLATLDNPDFAVSRLEIDRDGPTHTVDTLREMRYWFPSGKVEFYFITGIDAVMTMDSWAEAEELPNLCRVVAVNRPGFAGENYRFENLSERLRQSIVQIEIPLMSISSTDVRRRVSQKRTVRYLIPRAVEQYIAKRKLYCEDSGEGA
ncbi:MULTISPECIES: nicotinate-nucleotide adenylyltransferase [Jonquetella]|uniref:Probable nicotinate-nucleotide adenylyltransferase n=1 Tax=Jonquetella anthropi DSM 22815 TaxID=885272 RepID=H0UK99_9BACT|nr:MULTISPECIES: nicotinate-nucleotide adenylyltransferase [Jonquetella]EHM13108.1 nicotinate/nicotinamide nucleotide adenylyltransferase [Jonquetella anthropi DSM 22815]ERL23862.1 nicotinate-nucleotide adenylyltransferase [Jonquetella sp. BV3C21]